MSIPFLFPEEKKKLTPPLLFNNYIGFGPCPDFTGRCTLDFGKFSSSVLSIGVTLPYPFDSTVTVGQVLAPTSHPPSTLWIWYSECHDIELGNVQISGAQIPTPAPGPSVVNGKQRFQVLVQGFKIGCKTDIQINSLRVPITGDIGSVSVTLRLAKELQTNGTTVNVSTIFEAKDTSVAPSPYWSLDQHFPNKVSFEWCTFKVDIKVQVDAIRYLLIPFQNDFNEPVNFILGLVEPTFGGIACYILNQLITTVTGTEGILQHALSVVYNKTVEVSSKPDPIVAIEEYNLTKLILPSKLQAATRFNDSLIMEGASNVLNGWLPQTDPNSGLVVNEIVNLATMPHNGSATFKNLKSKGFFIEIPLAPAKVKVELLNLTLGGLNTFTLIDLIKDSYSLPADERLPFTLEHYIHATAMKFEVDADITLTDNPQPQWVNPPTVGPPMTFTIKYSGNLNSLDLHVFTTIVNNPSELFTKTVGQLTGKSSGATTLAGQLLDAAACFSPSMYAFALPFFKLNVNLNNLQFSLPDPNTKDIGIVNLVNDATTQILDLIAGLLSQMPAVSQHWVRPKVNQLLINTVVSGKTIGTCPTYVSKGVQLPNLQTSLVLETISDFLDRVIGGNPVRNTKASINEVMPKVIDFLITAFKLPGAQVLGGRGHYSFTPDVRIRAGAAFKNTGTLTTTKIEFQGLDSVTRLQVLKTNSVSAFDVYLNLGTASNPLTIAVGQHWVVDYDLATFPTRPDLLDEDFAFQVQVYGVQIHLRVDSQYDLDQLYQLTVKQLLHLPCFLSPFMSAAMQFDFSLTNIQVKVNTTSHGNANALHNSLVVLKNEASGPGFPNMLNFMAKSLFTKAAKLVNTFDPSLTPQNCSLVRSPFDTFTFRFIKKMLTTNLTQAAETGLGTQQVVPSYNVSDNSIVVPHGAKMWDLRASWLANIIPNALTGVTNANLRDILQRLGNGTGDLLSDSFTTEDDGSVSLDIDFPSTGIQLFKTGISIDGLVTGGYIKPQKLRITKLTSLDMTSLKIFSPQGRFVTQTYISIPDTMFIEAKILLDFPKEFKTGIAGPATDRVLETITFNISVTNLKVEIQTLTAINIGTLGDLSLGQFVTVDVNQKFSLNKAFMACFWSIFLKNGFQLPQLRISVGSMSQPVFAASPGVIVSPGTQQFVTAALGIFVDMYAKSLGDVTQGLVRTAIEELILIPNVENPGFCPDPAPLILPDSAKYLDWEKSSTVVFISDLTTKWLAGKDGTYGMLNSVLNSFFNAGVFFLANPGKGITNAKLAYKGSSLATVSFHLRDLNLQGLGTISALDLFDAISNTTFYNMIHINGPLKLQFVLDYAIQGLFVNEDAAGHHDELRLELDLTNLTIASNVKLVVNIPELLLLKASNFGDLSRISCVFTSVEDFGLNKFKLDLSSIKTSIECAGTCNSPIFKDLQAGGKLSSGDSKDSVANYVPKLINAGVNYLNSGAFSDFSNKKVNNAAQDCAVALNLTEVVAALNPTGYDELNVALIFGLAILGAVLGLVALVPLLIPRHYQIKDRMTALHLATATHEPGANAESVARFMAKCEREMLSLVMHPAVSLFWKIFLPSWAAINIILLGVSFIRDLSFSMDVAITLLGNKTKKITLVPWTISSTINDLWASGAWPLALLVVLASCSWPVIKNALLIGLWCAPNTLLTHHNREKYYALLDQLGKWSFLDVYVIVLLVGGLKFLLFLSNAQALSILPIPEQFLIVDVTVTPGMGIVELCLAAMFSLVVNHIMIWQEEKSLWSDRRLYKQIDNVMDDVLTPKALIRLPISEYVFSTIAPNGQRDRYGPKAKNMLIALAGSSIVALFIGMAVPFFSLTYGGLIGFALEFFQEGARRRTFSLFSVGTKLSEAADGTIQSGFLMFFFQLLYYLSVCAAPILHMLLHLFLWLRPLSLKDAKTTMFFARVSAYWASIEVFTVGVVATTIEIRPITIFLVDFITGGTCSAAKTLLSEVLGRDNGECLISGAELEWGFAIGFIALLMQIGTGAVFLRASGVAIRDREDVLENRPHQEWTMWEYRVLNVLLVHGAEHHKPQPQLQEHRKLNCCQRFERNPEAFCWSLNPLKCFCEGVQDISTPIGGGSFSNNNNNNNNKPPGSTSTTSKWNAPQQSSKWNAATPQQSGQWNMAPQQPSGQWPSQQGGGGQSGQWAGQSGQWGAQHVSNNQIAPQNPMLESANPVFKAEVNKRFSVDV
jgi:hypothetical protein